MTNLETTVIFWLAYSIIAVCISAYLVNLETNAVLTEKKSTYIFYISTFLIVSVPLSLFTICEIL